MAAVSIEGWQNPQHPKPVSLAHLMMKHAGLGLAAAKRRLDDLANHGQVVLHFSTSLSAANFVREARELGALTREIDP